LQKKEFTSFDVATCVRELKNTILNSRVNNIYQLDAKTLLFKLHKPDNPAFRLLIEAGKRMHLTSYEEEKLSTPPAFCMALRKYLRNSRLVNIEQHEFERIIAFQFTTNVGVSKLVLELFGEGNIVLANEKDEILQALAYKRMRDRNILRGETFVFAPSSGKNPFKTSREEFQEELKQFGDVEVVRALARLLSIGGLYAEEILQKSRVDKTKICKTLSDAEINAVFDCLQDLLSLVLQNKLEPCVVVDDRGNLVDVVPFRLKRYENLTHKAYNSFNEALDEFYTKISALEKAAAGIETETLKKELERLERISKSQREVLTEAEAKGEHYRKIGDTIYAHTSEVQALLDRVPIELKKGKDWKTVAAEILAEKRLGVKPGMFFESFEAKGMMVNVCIDDLHFSLDLRRNVYDNAGRFYEQSKKEKQRLDGAKAALEETNKKVREIEAKIAEAETLEQTKPAEAIEELEKRKIKRREWYEKFRWFTSSDGFLVVAGKDAVSNEVLIKKYATPDDIVFHADIQGAPFVIIKTEDKTPSTQCLNEAAEYAAAFSRAWREGFTSADVYWVKPEQLSKAGPSGEYVPKGAFAVTGKRNWMRNVPVRTSIGICIEGKNDEVSFVGGPVDAVKSKTKIQVIIVPGDYSGKEFLRHVLQALSLKVPKEQRGRILKASLEEIREYIPYNKGRLVEK